MVRCHHPQVHPRAVLIVHWPVQRVAFSLSLVPPVPACGLGCGAVLVFTVQSVWDSGRGTLLWAVRERRRVTHKHSWRTQRTFLLRHVLRVAGQELCSLSATMVRLVVCIAARVCSFHGGASPSGPRRTPSGAPAYFLRTRLSMAGVSGTMESTHPQRHKLAVDVSLVDFCWRQTSPTARKCCSCKVSLFKKPSDAFTPARTCTPKPCSQVAPRSFGERDIRQCRVVRNTTWSPENVEHMTKEHPALAPAGALRRKHHHC